MKIFELHSLFNGVKREIPPPKDLRKYFDMWKELAEQCGVTDFDFGSFVAGWTIGGNPALKERVLKLIYSKRNLGETFWNDHTK